MKCLKVQLFIYHVVLKSGKREHFYFTKHQLLNHAFRKIKLSPFFCIHCKFSLVICKFWWTCEVLHKAFHCCLCKQHAKSNGDPNSAKKKKAYVFIWVFTIQAAATFKTPFYSRRNGTTNFFLLNSNAGQNVVVGVD